MRNRPGYGRASQPMTVSCQTATYRIEFSNVYYTNDGKHGFQDSGEHRLPNPALNDSRVFFRCDRLILLLVFTLRGLSQYDLGGSD
jgi:hypothetical protein